MGEITPTTKFDLRDISYVRKILRMLLFYERKDISFISFLQRLKDYWNIAIVDNEDVEMKLLKLAIIKTTNLRLEYIPLETIRNEISITYPQLEPLIRVWEKEEELKDYTHEYEFIIRDLTNKFKVFAILKFAEKFKNILFKVSNPEVIEDYDTFSNLVNVIIKEFQEEVNIEPETSEIIYDPNDPSTIDEIIEDRLNYFLDKDSLKTIIPSSTELLNLSFNNLEGYEKRRLYIFASYIGTGKTRFLVAEGSNSFQRGFNVLHITIENDLRTINDYYHSSILGIPTDELYRIYRQFKKSEDAKKRLLEIKEALKEILTNSKSKLMIKKFPVDKTTPMMIETYIDQLSQTQFKPDIVIIDHIDLLIPDEAIAGSLAGNMYEIGKHLVVSLKNIAEKHNVLVLTATQVNREGQKDKSSMIESPPINQSSEENGNGKKGRKKKNPFESIISEKEVAKSLAKSEYADGFFSLNRIIDERLNNTARIFISKNRDGVDGLLFPIKFNTGICRIEDFDNISDIYRLYGDTNILYKSIAFLYYRACLDKNLRPLYINKLKEFVNYLDGSLKEKALKILHENLNTSSTQQISNNNNLERPKVVINPLKNSNTKDTKDILYPVRFIEELLNKLEDDTNTNIDIKSIDIDETQDVLEIEFTDKTKIKTYLSQFKHFVENSLDENNPDDKELKEFLLSLLEVESIGNGQENNNNNQSSIEENKEENEFNPKEYDLDF